MMIGTMRRFDDRHPKIAFINHGDIGLGDFLVCLRSVQLLKEKWPQCQVAYWGHRPYRTLALASGWIDEFHDMFSSELFEVREKECPLPHIYESSLSSCEIIVNHLDESDGYFSDNCARRGFRSLYRTGAPCLADLDSNERILLQGRTKSKELPAAAQVAQLLIPLGIRSNAWVARLKLPSDLLDAASSELGGEKWLAFHPGSNVAEKNYPLRRWMSAFKMVEQAVSLNLAIFCGPDERSILDEILSLAVGLNARIFHNRPLEECAALLSHCQFFAGHDSGFAHMAASVGVPSLILFGPISDPVIWAPPSPKSTVLRTEDFNELTEDRLACALSDCMMKAQIEKCLGTGNSCIMNDVLNVRKVFNVWAELRLAP